MTRPGADFRFDHDCLQVSTGGPSVWPGDSVRGTDGTAVNMQAVVDAFDAVPALRSKPKVRDSSSCFSKAQVASSLGLFFFVSIAFSESM